MRQFHELFVGRTDVYGTYRLSEQQSGSKLLGKATTVEGEVTKDMYDRHLAGEQSIGIIPIRPDNTVMWFAIDVDTYGSDSLHVDLALQINKVRLPLMIFRSKSGGAHLFCFLTKPILAAEARNNAQKFIKVLNLPTKTEIFPKQDKLSKDEFGSWINLPYFGKTRPCLGLDGRTELSLKEFLLLAAEKEVSPEDLEFKQKDANAINSDDKSEDAPPCIATMMRDGIEEGGRDNAMAHFSVYLKRAFPDEWEDKLLEANEDYCHPKLPIRDIMRIAKGAARKDYQYLCKQTPMVSICNKSACLKCKFGIGDGEGDLANFTIDNIRKIGNEDPYYVVTVDGLPVRMTSEEILQFRFFEKAVFEKLNKVISPMKPQEWKKILAEAMEFMEYEDAPEEFGTVGSILRSFYEWAGRRVVVGTPKERLVDGQPFYDSSGFVLFRGSDFISYAKRNISYSIDARIIWLALKEQGAEEVRESISGRKFRLWKFPIDEDHFMNRSQEIF